MPWLTRRAVQAAAAASSTSSTPACSPASPRSPARTMPAWASSARRRSAPAQVELACRQGGASQVSEAQLGMDLHHTHSRRGHPPEPAVDVQDLGPERERLAGDAFTGQPPAGGLGRREVTGLHRVADRRDEQRRPAPAQRRPRELVRAAPPGIGQADGDVDRDDPEGPARGRLLREFPDRRREVGPRIAAGEGDPDPAGPAGIDAEHPFAAHPPMVPADARTGGGNRRRDLPILSTERNQGDTFGYRTAPRPHPPLPAIQG